MVVLQVLRALFVLLMAAIGWVYVSNPQNVGNYAWTVMPITLTIGVLCVCVDILSPRHKLAAFSGTILGLLVGVAIAYALSFVITLLVDLIPHGTASPEPLVRFLNVCVGTVCCYFCISFVLQTRDDFRFIIPYVEFSKQQRGPRSLLIDTSVLIDGRIADIAETGFVESQIIIPQFVLDELQMVADSADKLKRARGKRGLDVLARLRSRPALDVKFYEASHLDDALPVDQKLLRLGKELSVRVVTTDTNLEKIGQLNGVDVININKLAGAMKPVVLPGEKMRVRLARPGEEAGQAVGYLDDGTMVVVEQARQKINEEVNLVVTRALQTSAGRMIFGRLATDDADEAPSAKADLRRSQI